MWWLVYKYFSGRNRPSKKSVCVRIWNPDTRQSEPFSRAKAISARKRKKMMTSTNTKKQERAQRIEDAWKSMSRARIEEIDSRARDIASGYNSDLDFAVEEAVCDVTDKFKKLVAEGYTEEEIEAVLKNHNVHRFGHDGYRSLWNLWNLEIAEPAPQRLGSIPIQKKKTA